MLNNFYVLEGIVETTVNEQPVYETVTFTAPLKYFTICGDYITYGGIPIKPVSLVELRDKLVGDKSYNDFLTSISDAQGALNSIITTLPMADASLLMLFDHESKLLIHKLRSVLLKNADEHTIAAVITENYRDLSTMVRSYTARITASAK